MNEAAFISEHRKECTNCRIVKSLECFRHTNNKRLSRRKKCLDCEKLIKQTAEYKAQSCAYQKKKRRDPKWRLRDLENAREIALTPKGRATRLWLAARHRAKSFNLAFDISKARIEVSLMIGRCERSGIVFDFSRPVKSHFNPFSPSIDKKSAFDGYTNENIQVVCNAYNLGKSQMTDEQFVEFCRKVVAYNDK